MGIKQSIAHYYFKIEAKKKKRIERIFTPFTQAKLIGILYNADDENEKRDALKLAETLRTQKKEVLLMGYMHVKKFPPQLHIAYGTEFFNRTHLNWAGLPTHSHLHTYLQQNFDYLINLDPKEQVIFSFLLAKSNAKCRIGRYSNTYKEVYDLMLETKQNDFIAQLLHYLQKIG